jgi:hypothetical protein
MNWKFWRKKPKEDVISVTDLESIMKLRDQFMAKRASATQCPPWHAATHMCKCMSCPIKETCYVEKMCFAADCRTTYILECSQKKALLGDQHAKEEVSATGEPNLGTACILSEKFCGESFDRGVRDAGVVSPDRESSSRLDTVGED